MGGFKRKPEPQSKIPSRSGPFVAAAGCVYSLQMTRLKNKTQRLSQVVRAAQYIYRSLYLIIFYINCLGCWWAITAIKFDKTDMFSHSTQVSRLFSRDSNKQLAIKIWSISSNNYITNLLKLNVQIFWSSPLVFSLFEMHEWGVEDLRQIRFNFSQRRGTHWTFNILKWITFSWGHSNYILKGLITIARYMSIVLRNKLHSLCRWLFNYELYITERC